MEKIATTRKLPANTIFRNICDGPYNTRVGYSSRVGHSSEYVGYSQDYNETIQEDSGAKLAEKYNLITIYCYKMEMLVRIRDFLSKSGEFVFDEFNGLPPTRINAYKSYELSAVWFWNELVYFIKNPDDRPTDSYYRKYAGVIASVFRKYPKITSILISLLDLHMPGNKFLDYAKMDNVDFDADHSDENMDDTKAEEFKKWILHWTGMATDKDVLRVRRWFETKKSHKQIFAEINKVAGNPLKFNARLALFVERLFNQTGLEYFFEKTGFDSKEELFLAYFDKLTQFDDGTKRSFIKKYLLG